MAGASPLREISPEVTASLLKIAAAGTEDPTRLTSQALDAQIVTHDAIALKKLGAAAKASGSLPSERDSLEAENHHRTAAHLRAIRQDLFGTGAGSISLTDAQSRASGFRLRWNDISNPTSRR